MSDDHWIKILPPDAPEPTVEPEDVLRMVFGVEAEDLGKPHVWTFTPKRSPSERDN